MAHGGGSETGVFKYRGDKEVDMFESSAPLTEASTGAIVELNCKGMANQQYQNHIKIILKQGKCTIYILIRIFCTLNRGIRWRDC